MEPRFLFRFLVAGFRGLAPTIEVCRGFRRFRIGEVAPDAISAVTRRTGLQSAKGLTWV